MHFDCVLINNSYLENLSVRYLSAHLKSKGYRVVTIHYEGRKNDVFNLLTRQSLKALAACCREASLVGISLLTTHQLSRSRQIQDFLAGRIKAPIIWGGVPVICDPEFYLQYTDYVCLGEGEPVLEALLEGRDPLAVKGLGFRAEDGSLHCNPLPDLLDVNTGPIPVLDLEDGFFLQDDGELLPVPEGMEPVHRSYSILSIRGCPYHCSYCLNSCLKNIFAGTGASIRFVSTSRVIEELEQAKSDLPDLKRVIFDDDDFFLRSESDLQQLCDAYTRKINLPIFYIQAHMHTITEKKVDILLHSGIRLQYLKIGLQSASVRVNQAIFDRRFEKDRFLEGLRMLSAKGVRVMLDVISANPYETAEDSYASLVFYEQLIRQTRKLSTTALPMKIYDHKLMFYPGSKLYEQAKHDGLIADDYVEKVLLQRNTLRRMEEDIDHEAFVVALVNRALRSRSSLHPAALLLRLLRVKPLYTLVYRGRLVNRIYHRTGLNLAGLFTKG